MVLIVVACSGPGQNRLNLRCWPGDGGASLVVAWDKVRGADYYRISVDGVAVDSTQDDNTLSIALGPEHSGKIVRVEAVGADIYEEVDLSPWEFGVILFSREDPDSLHPEAAGFQYGYLERYFIRDIAHWDDIDFYLGNENGDSAVDINSPRVYGINNRYNMTAPWGGGDVAPDTGYGLTTNLVQGHEISLWLSWDTLWDSVWDNYARVVVDSVDSFRAELRVYYQAEPGLRWVVKP